MVANVKPGSRITSDAEHAFGSLSYVERGYQHTVLNNQAGERSRGTANNNTIEGFWGMLKRGINGTSSALAEAPPDVPKRVRVPL